MWTTFGLVLTIFFLMEGEANIRHPLPLSKRWKAILWLAVSTGTLLAILPANNRVDNADPQRLADLSYHPLASNIGAAIPAFCIGLVGWYLTRKRLLNEYNDVKPSDELASGAASERGLSMSEAVKAALIIAGALLLAASLFIYFSPYHSCVRSGGSATWCARALGRGFGG